MENGIAKTKESVVESLAKQASPPLALMSTPPANPMSRQVISEQVWTGFLMRFEGTLSERDKFLLHNPPADPGKSPEHLRVMHMFDDFLLSQIGEQGPMLVLCFGTQQRIFEWRKHSPELLLRLGTELEHEARVFRSEGKARLPKDIHRFADDAIPQLDQLLRKQRDHFGSRTLPTCGAVARWMKTEIETRPGEFPALYGNLAQLCGWVETLEDHNPRAARLIRRATERASSVFLLWYSDLTNRSLKDVKNQISRLRNER
jgi:hypothetical protein